MSNRIVLALLSAIVAITFFAPAADNGNRENQGTYQVAQYCVPHMDDIPSSTRLYC